METQSRDGDSLEKRPGIFFLGSPGVVKRSLISQSLPMYEQLAALILVFDTTELSSLSALQEWVSQTDLQKFDILVCVGNIEDDCRSLETRLLMPVQGSLRMESPRLKEAVYWGMTSHFGGLATHVWNGALSITLSSLKLALQILILTNVRFVS
nr:uncharacterized protein LOC103411492 isoform X3 [Malus domestica]